MHAHTNLNSSFSRNFSLLNLSLHGNHLKEKLWKKNIYKYLYSNLNTINYKLLMFFLLSLSFLYLCASHMLSNATVME